MPITSTSEYEVVSSDGKYTAKVVTTSSYGDDDDIDYDSYYGYTVNVINNDSGKTQHSFGGGAQYTSLPSPLLKFTPDNQVLIYSVPSQDYFEDEYVSYNFIDLNNNKVTNITGNLYYGSDIVKNFELTPDGSKILYTIIRKTWDGEYTENGYAYIPTVPQLTAATSTGAGITSGNGTLTVGQTAMLTIDLIQVDSVSAPENMTLTLNSGVIARYDAAASALSQKLVFSFTVQTDQFTPDLSVTAFNLNGAILKGAGGKQVVIDGPLLDIAGKLAVNGYVGTAANETFNGTSGAETFEGKGGNDTYLINNAGDKVVEAKGGGSDVLVSTITYALTAGQEIETLQLAKNTGNKALDLTGNEFAQTIRGNAGANRLDGGGGDDKLYGHAGDDIYLVDRATDQAFEARGQGNDAVLAKVTYTLVAGQEIERLYADNAASTKALDLQGNEFAQTLRGNAGNNVLNGAGGIDTAIGGKGDDTYRVDNAWDVVIERTNEGNDTLVATASYALAAGQSIETLRLAGLTGGANLNLAGNEFAQTLYGNAGNNTLDGKGGQDKLYGGLGNDVYGVDNARDQVFESKGQGSDTVVASTSYNLASGQEIERMQLARATGQKNLDLNGNEFAQTLIGNAGNNVLDGKGGADQLYGGAGNDTYAVDNAADRVFEAKGQGKDTVVTSTTYTLAEGQEIEALQLAKATQFKNFDLTGNGFAQTLAGNDGNNVLDGRGGSDILRGGKGQDSFVFSVAPSAGNVDHVADFTPVDDGIRLAKSVFSALAAGPLADALFKDVGNAGAAIDRDDRVIYDHRNGALYFDSNGSDAGNRTLIAILDNKALLTHDDFFVV